MMPWATCWNCGSDLLETRPDAAMQNMTDETVCVECREVQPDD